MGIFRANQGWPHAPAGWVLIFFLGLLNGCSTSSGQLRQASRTHHHHSHLATKSIGPSEDTSTLGSTHIVNSSWYGPGYAGHRTASGQRFDQSQPTAASKTLPLGSTVRVTNPKNGKSTEVKITDRGPAVPGRELDLSPAAAQQIGVKKAGVAPVEITPVSER
jgi:rare lipoprotein A